ncbi:Anoctamin-10 [Phytophthora ramorum]|uniref:Anoctamin transmembrane domain-containing protein n=1 Tax=Phytophthora ramorum TaxID=164328 RepID=H3GQ61_PHYRM|nr:Anoctamin-10 [Phytophthora ramorum]
MSKDVGAPVPQDSTRAVESAVDEHSIQVDFTPKNKPASIFLKYGGVSDAYENTMFEHDLVMIFPLREGGEAKRPGAFTMKTFVELLLGRDSKTSRQPFQRVLRTPRCFLDDLGNDMVESTGPRHSSTADVGTQAVEQKILEAEYEKFIGSTEPTTEQRFCELVATAISRRVQLACGLTTRMFLSCDADEIIMTIKSENDDLRVEADRTNYRLQLSNKPFDDMLHKDKIQELKSEIGQDGWQKSLDHLRTKRGTADETSDVPEMDPLLVSRGTEFHPETRKALLGWGHREEADGMFSNDDNHSQNRWNRFWTSIFSLHHDPMTYFAPFADYRHEPEFQAYFRRYPMNWGGKKEQTLFTQKDRIRLASGIVDRHINLDALEDAGFLKNQMFALHDEVALAELRTTWALNVKMLYQPLHKIRFYFGEKIALYFAWLEFYTKMLIFPSIAGIITIIYDEGRDEHGNENNRGYFLVAFAIFVVIWSSMFSELWRRKNGLLGSLWGCQSFNEVFRYRPQFRGTKSFHPVTDAEELTYESRSKRHRWFVVSVTVVTIMVGIVIVALVGLFVLKHYINDGNNLKNIDIKYRTPLTLAVTIANAVQILILNMVYRLVAGKLNDLENHRTDAEYENYLAIKVFMFQFCNSFASFFYIAFIKRDAEGSCLYGDDCMKELRDQLLVLFLVRIVVGNTMEVAVPYLKYRYQLYAEHKTQEDKKVKQNLVEIQAKLAPYESNEAFEDYNELAIQFGFHNLFVVAFPLTPLLALVNNIVEVHVDASKLCFGCRRPFPHPAKSIGVWFYIFRFISYMTVGTNAALILWTSNLFENYSGTVKAFSLIIVWQVGMGLSLAIERTVPDTPLVLGQLLERYDHIVNVVFKNLSEGDASHLNEVSEDLDLTIYPNDQWEDTRGGVKTVLQMRVDDTEVRPAGYPQHELEVISESLPDTN